MDWLLVMIVTHGLVFLVGMMYGRERQRILQSRTRVEFGRNDK